MTCAFRNSLCALTIAVAILLSSPLAAQEVALISSYRGTVVIKKSSGEMVRAIALDKLMVGDEVMTGDTSSALVFYYSGKEVNLSANKRHVITQETEQSYLIDRLTAVFASLFWGKSSDGSRVGATRGLGNKDLLAVSPSGIILRDTVLTFVWNDSNFTPSHRYVLHLIDETGQPLRKIQVAGSQQYSMRFDLKGAAQQRKYQWYVQDELTNRISERKEFSFLSIRDSVRLAESMKEIAALLGNDTTSARLNLMKGLLYQEFGLTENAERELSLFVTKRPDHLVGRGLLEKVRQQMAK